MEPYAVAMQRAVEQGRQDWLAVRKWIELFVCGTNRSQGVVGRRHWGEGTVTQAMLDAGDRSAHVCPFVRDSLDAGLFFIEESPLTDPMEIRRLILSRADPFIAHAPAFDPAATGRLAEMPEALKTLLVFFPQYHAEHHGVDPAIDRIFNWMITAFIRRGLMLGQFYRGCAVPAVHNPAWTKVLTAPYLAFALRYMQPHDKLFIPENSPGYAIYKKLCGGHP